MVDSSALFPAIGSIATQRRPANAAPTGPISSDRIQSQDSSISNSSPSHQATPFLTSGATSSSTSSNTLGLPEGTMTTTTAALTFGLFKGFIRLLKISTILLRVALWPLFKVISAIFPPLEYDGIHNDNGADKAAKAFVTMIRSHITKVRPITHENISNTSQTGGGTGITIGRNDREQYVEPHCPFVSRGYKATLSYIANHTAADVPVTTASTADGDNAYPLLFIYLHSPLHRNGDKFIQDYLCHPPLLQLLNSHSAGCDRMAANTGDTRGGSVVCWGASVHSADGQHIRERFHVTRFPFLALLSVKSNRSVQSRRGSSNAIVNNESNHSNDLNHPYQQSQQSLLIEFLLRMEGPQLLTIPPSQITTHISTTISRHLELVAQTVARRLQREEEVRLRQEQDREYQEALLADQIREIERIEREEQARKEEEERRELERMEGEKERRRLEVAKELMEKCGYEEPLTGSVGVTKIRFALPNGKKIDRGFRYTDKVQVVRAYLILYFEEQGMNMKNFGISTNFPKRSFKEEDDDILTLEEAGLVPQAMIMVQDLDA